ncbi:hypothetical protein [Shinella sp. BYT-45]|uniref:hypothetical protein n=1 Tax=Shinella sp. BYT-45 TaxID=3377377 RepID=UPI0039812D54
MPVLVRYILARLCTGFVLGTISAAGILLVNPAAFGGPTSVLEVLLVAYGLGSAFAAGYLATALANEHDER